MVEEAGHCRDPGRYVQALSQLTRDRGAKYITTRATGFRLEGDRLAAVITEHGDVPCYSAVVAAGARSKALTMSLGDPVPLESERGYHVMVANAEVGPRTPMMVSDAKMIVNHMNGGVRAAGQVEFAGLAAAPNWKRAEVLREHLLAMFPTLPRMMAADNNHVWLGHRPSMPDGRPCIGTARKTPDVIYAFGHRHVGLVGSARTGRLVAQLVSRTEPENALAAFDPRRFI